MTCGVVVAVAVAVIGCEMGSPAKAHAGAVSAAQFKSNILQKELEGAQAAPRAALSPSRASSSAASSGASPSAVSPAVATTLPPGGISNTPQAPFPRVFFMTVNSWSGEIGASWLTVYAGQPGQLDQQSSAGTTASGGVVVFAEPLSAVNTGVMGTPQTVLDPSVRTSLQIVSVTGSTMTLETTDATPTVVTFNLATLTFSS
jgi:hypothetical protein